MDILKIVTTWIPLLANLFLQVAPKAWDVYEQTDEALQALDKDDKGAIEKELGEARKAVRELSKTLINYDIGESGARFILTGIHIIKKHFSRHKDKEVHKDYKVEVPEDLIS